LLTICPIDSHSALFDNQVPRRHCADFDLLYGATIHFRLFLIFGQAKKPDFTLTFVFVVLGPDDHFRLSSTPLCSFFLRVELWKRKEIELPEEGFGPENEGEDDLENPSSSLSLSVRVTSSIQTVNGSMGALYRRGSVVAERRLG
jgi:hypothetical protein